MNVFKKTALSLAITGALVASTTAIAVPNGKPFIVINDKIVEIEGSIGSLQDQINDLVGRVDSIEDYQAALATAVSDLQAEDVVLQEQIDSLGDEDGILQGNINDNAILLAALQAQVDLIADELVQKQNIIDGYCPDGSAIQEVMENGSVICQEVSGNGGSFNTVTAYNYSYSSSVAWHSLTATCPFGYQVTGGGYHGHNLDLSNNGPYGSGWDVYGYAQWDLYSYARCIQMSE